MKARMPSELAQSRTKVVTTREVVSKILKLLAAIGAVANYFVRPSHPPPAEGPVEAAALGAGDVSTDSDATDVTVGPDPEIIPITDAEIRKFIPVHSAKAMTWASRRFGFQYCRDQRRKKARVTAAQRRCARGERPCGRNSNSFDEITSHHLPRGPGPAS